MKIFRDLVTVSSLRLDCLASTGRPSISNVLPTSLAASASDAAVRNAKAFCLPVSRSRGISTRSTFACWEKKVCGAGGRGTGRSAGKPARGWQTRRARDPAHLQPLFGGVARDAAEEDARPRRIAVPRLLMTAAAPRGPVVVQRSRLRGRWAAWQVGSGRIATLRRSRARTGAPSHGSRVHSVGQEPRAPPDPRPPRLHGFRSVVLLILPLRLVSGVVVLVFLLRGREKDPGTRLRADTRP